MPKKEFGYLFCNNQPNNRKSHVSTNCKYHQCIHMIGGCMLIDEKENAEKSVNTWKISKSIREINLA